jgi:DNA polymerase-3 subunit epsilon
MSYINKLQTRLEKNCISINTFNQILKNNKTFFDSIDLQKELILSNGMPLYFDKNNVHLKTLNTKIKDQVFCVVDIETTAGNANDGQIIELAAIKVKNNKIIETYESLVTANSIPKKVQEITGITLDMLKDAPNLKDVLEEFKIFIEDDVFVAHNISFDYKFISDSLKKYDLGELFNPKLCTIELAKRTFLAKRYGLKYLKEEFDIKVDGHHRAYIDTLSTVYVFEKSLENLPDDIIYTQDLINFSKTSEVLSEN